MPDILSPEGAEEFDPLNYHTIAETVAAALLRKDTDTLPPVATFPGSGVYLIYYIGKFPPYAAIKGTDRPIYAGRAIPSGSRRGLHEIEHTRSPMLFNRLREHAQSIGAAKNLKLEDFRCRYLVVTPIWISIAESLLVAKFRPLWNSVVDGFGLHDPGPTRYNQKKSEWDTLHPGRSWEPMMQPGKSVETIEQAIRKHLSG